MGAFIIKPGRSPLMKAVRELERKQARNEARYKKVLGPKPDDLPPAMPDTKGIRTPHERRKAAAPLPPGQAAELRAAVKKPAAKKKARKP